MGHLGGPLASFLRGLAQRVGFYRQLMGHISPQRPAAGTWTVLLEKSGRSARPPSCPSGMAEHLADLELFGGNSYLPLTHRPFSGSGVLETPIQLCPALYRPCQGLTLYLEHSSDSSLLPISTCTFGPGPPLKLTSLYPCHPPCPAHGSSVCRTHQAHPWPRPGPGSPLPGISIYILVLPAASRQGGCL